MEKDWTQTGQSIEEVYKKYGKRVEKEGRHFCVISIDYLLLKPPPALKCCHFKF